MGAAAHPYRHSRVSGNPAAVGQQRADLFSTVQDSRLRGNDGYKAARRECSGRGHLHRPILQVIRHIPEPVLKAQAGQVGLPHSGYFRRPGLPP